MQPAYNLDKIKFATDRSAFEKAVGIYDLDGVKDFKDDGFGFAAKVRGSGGNFYKVYVSAKHYDQGNCNCYLGQNDIFCKHMVAVAIYAVKGGKKLSIEEKELVGSPRCGGKLGELEKTELVEIKAEISAAMRHIKPYNGPSRIWFAYQDSLMEGCNRLAAIVSKLPVSKQTAKLLVDLLLRLDRKLCQGGVDDSDGTVGGFMSETVGVLEEYAKIDPKCIETFELLCGLETCFEWEEPLVRIVDENSVKLNAGIPF